MKEEQKTGSFLTNSSSYPEGHKGKSQMKAKTGNFSINSSSYPEGHKGKSQMK